MPTTTDYTSILYTADGQPSFAWNALATVRTAVIVTYSFVETADLGPWQAGASYSNDGYTSMTEAQRANLRDALAVFEAVAGIRFVETTSGQGMINAMNTSGSGYGGWADVANSSASYTGHGELVIDNRSNYDEGGFGFLSILHELGHAMGLQHPWEGDVTLDPAIDNQAHTVMTYHTSTPYTAQLGSLDVDAMRAQYGLVGATAGWSIAMAAGVLQVAGSNRGDRIIGAAGENVIDGGLGGDRIWGRAEDDILRGGVGRDRLWGSAGNDKVFGGAGDDRLYGYTTKEGWADGNDSLYGGAGNDRIFGGVHDDLLIGGRGRDYMDSRDGSDTLRGGAGADRLYGGVAGDDWGHQTFYGGTGTDLISGGAGNDTLYGGTQDDTLDGGAGWDVLYGGGGDDVFLAGGGNALDTFTGGAGADRFVLAAADSGAQIYLTDFTRGEDKIDLRDLGLGFSDVAKQANWLHIGTVWINTSVALQVTADDFLF